jgi:hypothetical protein
MYSRCIPEKYTIFKKKILKRLYIFGKICQDVDN